MNQNERAKYKEYHDPLVARALPLAGQPVESGSGACGHHLPGALPAAAVRHRVDRKREVVGHAGSGLHLGGGVVGVRLGAPVDVPQVLRGTGVDVG